MKCPNCNAEVEDGMKFCGECGAKIEYVKRSNSSDGITMGDKNVIAGDVIDKKEEYKISGNATIVKNEDESRKVLSCSVCGKHFLNVEAITCPKCGRTVCEEHFNKAKNECVSCSEENASNKEQTYINALQKAYEDDRVDIDERKSLNALKTELGLSDKQAEDLEQRVASSHKVKLTGLSRRDQYSLLQGKKALYEDFDWQTAYGIAHELYEENPDNKEILDLYLYSLSYTDVRGDELIQFVDSLEADFDTAYFLKISKLEGNEKEALIAEARKKFPDDFRIAAKEIVDIANFAVATRNDSVIAETKEKVKAIKEPANEMDNAIYKSYINLINTLLETKDSEQVSKSCAKYYKEHKNEKYALFAYSFIDTEKAKEEFFDKKQGDIDAKAALENNSRKEENVLRTSSVAGSGLTRNEIYEFEKAKKSLLENCNPSSALKILEPLYRKYGNENTEIVSLYIRALKYVDENKTRQIISSLGNDIEEAVIANIDLTLKNGNLDNVEKLLNDAKRKFPNDVVIKCKEIEYLLEFYKKFGDKNIVQEVGALAKELPISKDDYEKAAVDFAKAISARVAGDEDTYQDASKKYSKESGNVSLFMEMHHKKLGEIKCSRCGKWGLPYSDDEDDEDDEVLCKNCGGKDSTKDAVKQKRKKVVKRIVQISFPIITVVLNFFFFRFSHTTYVSVKDSYPWWKYLLLCFSLPVSTWTIIICIVYYQFRDNKNNMYKLSVEIGAFILVFLVSFVILFILGWIILPFNIGTIILSIIYTLVSVFVLPQSI